MTIFEAIQELNIPDLTEQAMSRRDAINHACDLSLHFIEHFDKIYNDIDNIAINHRASEMQAGLDHVNNLKLSSTKKTLTNQQKIDWFFTSGSDYETLFKNKTEAQVYSEFVDLVLENNDVKKSLKILELMED